MSTDTPDVMLTLAQWFSPAFPIGAFSFSHGLESLVETGEIRSAEDVEAWLNSVLNYGAGRNDVILMAVSFRASSKDEIREIDALARALSPSKERLLETEVQGEAFIRTINEVWGSELPALCYPVAIGASARACGMPLRETACMYLHALTSSLVSAAIRVVPLGQTEGQSIVRRLAPLCDELGSGYIDESLEAIGSSSFIGDIASMTHEDQYSRMFRS
ncbi:urease accessory protein UreF [Phaeobacter sp. 22II1-1F12B]|uniref:urease accessory protein UreF n=1 Tax=Phaeobacter sp. 22II1-1F12B TaxID=1317111 RepID=UPI000B6F30BC|nr:urease accessory protein UreF [Phaeobacter sp. 22II1-1F12B]OWU79234.1 urease accessory protein UreF [Phaeobacter sp. 22II1-1F12B]